MTHTYKHTQKTLKKKIDRCDYIKIKKKFCMLKKKGKNRKHHKTGKIRGQIKWQKKLEAHSSGKGLISLIYKKLL